MRIQTSHGGGRYVAGETDLVARRLPGLPPLVWCHGATGTTETTWKNATQRTLLTELAHSFTVGVADLGFDVYGNDTHVTRIGQMLAYLRATWGAVGPATLLVESMGTLGGLAYTLANPGQVARVACTIPALDLADVVANNRLGLASAVNAAYGGAYDDAVHGPTHSPVRFAAALPAQLPIRMWTSSNDTATVPSTAAAFVAARPQTVRTDLGAVGHNADSSAGARDQIVRWLRDAA